MVMPVPEKIESKLKEFENTGKTAVLVTIDSKLSGIMALADTVKDECEKSNRGFEIQG